ncbi:hypothetical protein EVAR_31527_1 [Eumeta japonica]|uniref:Uncharacterized protein n=1 Tax=Eumeta variegata TaxID=151549 RepID=A0A4C1Z3K7_EUMVA|nr:hypothetical protein EVAR_31527_1 [Eumeta japonica]
MTRSDPRAARYVHSAATLHATNVIPQSLSDRMLVYVYNLFEAAMPVTSDMPERLQVPTIYNRREYVQISGVGRRVLCRFKSAINLSSTTQ